MLRPALIRCFELAGYIAAGTLEVREGWGDTREIPVLTATMSGIAVEATIERARLGQFFRTIVSAPALGALGLSLQLTRTRRSSDVDFERDYALRTNDADYGRLWLDERVRRRVINAHQLYSSNPFVFEVADERAMAIRAGFEEDPEQLARAMNAVAALATRGRRLLDEWTKVADALGGNVAATGTWRPDTRAHIGVRLGGARLVIDNIYGAVADGNGSGTGTGRTLLTRVSCLRATAEPDVFSIADRRSDNPVRPHLRGASRELTSAESSVAGAYKIMCQHSERVIKRLNERVCALLLANRPAAVLANGSQVSVLLTGFVSEPVRIREAMELSRALAVQIESAGLAGPYR